MNLQREAKAVRRLLDEADALEHEATLKTVEADDRRWEAAERTYEITTGPERVTQGKFATAAALSTNRVSTMVRVWKWWQECNELLDGRPTYWDADELSKDASLKQRAAASGKSPTTTAIQERHAKAVAKSPAQAAAVVKDKAAREGLKRAIRQVEEEEDRAEVEAIRQKALADKAAAGRPDLDAPPPASGFGVNAQMEAGVLLGTAGKSLAAFIRLVKQRGPVPEIAREALLEELDELAGRVQWAREALLNRITDWDEALAQLTGD